MIEFGGLFGFSKKKVPLILQSEAAECGLACCAMIAGYYGHNIDLIEFRNKVSISLKGLDLKGVMSCADSLNFNTRPVRVELNEVGSLQLPAIVHFDFTHFVVLTKVTNKHLYVSDPAKGESRYTFSEFSEHFTGIALEFFPSADFTKKIEKNTLTFSSLFHNLTGIRRLLLQILFLSFLLQLFTLLLPYFSQFVIDNILISADTDFLFILGSVFILLGVFKAINVWFRGRVIIYLSSNLSVQLMPRLLRKLFSLPISYFEKRHVGDIQSRFASLDEIQQVISTELIAAIVDGLASSIIIIVMYLYSPLLAGISTSAVVIYSLYRYFTFTHLKKTLNGQISTKALTDSLFLESLRGIVPLKNFSIEPKRVSVWLNSYVRSINADIKISNLRLSYTVLTDFLSYIELVIIVWLGSLAILEQSFTIGMLMAFLAFRQSFSSQSRSLIDKAFELKLLKVHLSRVADIVHSESETDYEGMGLSSDSKIGDIKLENISYKYADNEPWVFQQLSFHIKAGECVAIIGTSGAGKTTLMKIILGLLKPNSGNVQLNNMDIKKIGLKNYRKFISVVMQDDNLFSGTLKDNISMFDPTPDESLILKVAKSACIFEDINQMPMGMNSLIGDMGSSLSGGQKQRILIARALYREPKIIFFDESTCHLDPMTERKINRSIKKLGITRIIVAHREETILLAERIINMDDLVLNVSPTENN
jgi:ATP-binding cassette subfamily B protein RaxB